MHVAAPYSQYCRLILDPDSWSWSLQSRYFFWCSVVLLALWSFGFTATCACWLCALFAQVQMSPSPCLRPAWPNTTTRPTQTRRLAVRNCRWSSVKSWSSTTCTRCKVNIGCTCRTNRAPRATCPSRMFTDWKEACRGLPTKRWWVAVFELRLTNLLFVSKIS